MRIGRLRIHVLTLAGVLAFGLTAPGVSAQNNDKMDTTSPLVSAIQSPACGGSCVALTRTQSQLYLEVRDPDTGRLFKLVDLGLDADAVVGAFNEATVASEHAPDLQAAQANDQSTQSIPNPPPSGTGTVRETAPFMDDQGSGEMQITYVFVNYKLRDIVIQKIYFRLLPK